ncbi:hypothetical protein diail_6590 [Diaporthe ilicicola]|nr:hypothetical protein diail_6590 [Diaporthe ilicicola]
MASAARERGNAFYKQGKLQDAIKCYEEAASLAPDDPAPISNLSAAKFEMGKYPEAAELAQRALSMTDGESPSKEKLRLRLARCHLHCLQTQQARAALETCGDSETKAVITESLTAIDSMQHTEKDRQRLRRDVLDRLPRQDEPEYYPIGNDAAKPLFDARMATNSDRNSSLSFLFCGIGDARHLWLTLTQFMVQSDQGGETPKELHFTLVDLKPAALARILILLTLLSRLPPLENLSSPALQEATWAIVYLYIGHVVPPFAQEALSRTVSELIRGLEKNNAKNAQLRWVVMPESTRVQVLEHLRNWSRPLDDLYRPENMREMVKVSDRRVNMTRMMLGAVGGWPTPSSCEEDEAVFKEFTIIPPPASSIRLREPEIGRLLDLTKSPRGNAQQRARHSAAVDEYVNQHWKTNPTLIDLVWEARKDRNSDPGHPSQPEWQRLTPLEGEPISLLQRILSDADPLGIHGQKGVVELMGTYFAIVGTSLLYIQHRSRLRVEMIAGEMTDIMERLRYGCLDDRAGSGSPQSFPKTFDRVHMSNVPDYVGGVLGALLYARPVLKDKNSSFQYNCLLNPPLFKSHAHFSSEYALMSSKQELRDHFCAELINQDDERTDFYLGSKYWVWKPSGDTDEIPWGRLMPRARVERWLYAHFLKICLPASRDPKYPNRGAPVYAPLNLTAFLRLVVRLAERGYPAHWLSTVIENLTSGVIKTTARAPRTDALDVKAVDTIHPLRPMSVAPWMAEFTTLLGIWRGLMPFGFAVASGAHVTPADVYEYSVTFPDFREEDARFRVPHFVLVFENTELGKTGQSLRKTLLDDEAGDNSERAKKARAEGLHVVATFKYVTDTRTASFWMRQDVADELCRGKWSVAIWRTDSWKKQFGAVLASSHMVKGQPWS